jgi:hypothetical protein
MIAFPAVHVQFAPLTFIDQLFFEQSSTGFVERVDAGPAEFGRQRLKPPLTAAANPAEGIGLRLFDLTFDRYVCSLLLSSTNG